MCAIAGVISLAAEQSTQKAMLRTMACRGPDGSGIWQNQRCCLLHSRLAIIDPAGGAQPMVLQDAQEQYVLVYNGELYNTAELRRELERLGHCFVGHSDTEVLLHAYVRWGREVLHRLNGIFAFAVWEVKKNRLFLARDRIGVKPLFYMHHHGGLLFASEMKTILAYPTVRAQLDPQGAAEIALLGPGRTPGCGVFRGMQELEPGCFGYYENGKLELSRYWMLRDREHSDSFEETRDHVRYLVLDAIQRQMVSDVPIGTFLSGGLDSSLISAVCARKMKDEGARLQTFSLDYVGNSKHFVPGKFQPNSDTHYIRLMQEVLDCDADWTVLSTQELLDDLTPAMIARDLPGMADVDSSLLAFCRRIRSHVKVALSGECADEIFGGYPWYRDPQIRSRSGFPWAQNAQQRSDLLTEDLTGKISALDYIQDRYNDTCAQSDILPGTPKEERRMKEMTNLNFRWFMQTLLDRKDRMSMYSGLEIRVPFCDWRIAEYLYGVPWKFKDWDGKEKGLLRAAMADLLPEEILWRRKSPYPKTFDPLYTQQVQEKMRVLLEDTHAPIFHMLDRGMLRRLLEAEGPWPWYGQLMRGPQTLAYVLQINSWLNHYRIEFLF